MTNCGNITKPKTRVYNYLASQNVFENLPKEISDDVVLYPNNFVISSKLSHFYSGKDGKLVFENGKPVSWEQYANRYLIGYVKDTYGMELSQETKLVEFIYPKEKNKYSLPYVSFNEEVLERIERFAYEYPQEKQQPLLIKPGVQELFESNPELAAIGTPEQYSQYLDTIFPDSKVKDIVYRADKRIDLTEETTVDDYTQVYVDGVYYSTELQYAINYNKILNGKIYFTLLNIKNPGEIKTKEDIERLGRNKKEFKKVNDLKYKNNPKDSLIFDNTIYKTWDKYGEVGKEIVVFEPEQIHILGSKQDIEGFKEFVSGETTKEEAPPFYEMSAEEREQRFQDFYKNNQNISEEEAREYFNKCMI